MLAAERLRENADRLVRHYVDEAMAADVSWTTVGQSLGLTRQAAQRRYGSGGNDADSALAFGLADARDGFARFTREARRAVGFAGTEAHRVGHHQLGAEHILCGVVEDPESSAAKALNALGVPRERVRTAVFQVFAPAAEAIRAPGGIPLTVASRVILTDRAPREADRLGHALVGTEHLLLGLLADTDGPAEAVLTEFGVTRESFLGVLPADT